MKNKLKLITIILFLILLTACSKVNSEYNKYKNLDEVYIEENKVSIILFENQALPYRWKFNKIDGDEYSLEEKTIVKENLFPFSSGTSNAYHIFEFSIANEGLFVGEFSLTNINNNESKETKTYYFKIENNIIKVSNEAF